MAEWEIPERLLKADIDVLKFAYSQVESRQKDIDATIAAIGNRIQALLTVLVGVLVATIGFLFTHQNDAPEIVFPTLVAIVYSLLICWYLLERAYLGKYFPSSGAPSDIFEPSTLNQEDDKVLLRSMYLSALYSADIRFRVNRTENERRFTVIRRAITAAVLMIPVLMLSYFVVLRFC